MESWVILLATPANEKQNFEVMTEKIVSRLSFDNL